MFHHVGTGVTHEISSHMGSTSTIFLEERKCFEVVEGEGCIPIFFSLLFHKQLPLLASSYASTRNDSSFPSYFALTTPDSDHKRTRLKTILFLAGSSFYDPEVIRDSLLPQEKLLKFELAEIQSKVRVFWRCERKIVTLRPLARKSQICSFHPCP